MRLEIRYLNEFTYGEPAWESHNLGASARPAAPRKCSRGRSKQSAAPSFPIASTVRNFLRAHELGFAVTLPQERGRTLVLWSDIRFCWDAPPGASKLEPNVQSAAGDSQLACSLWFGGEFDADGRPRLAIVKVGGFTQTRPPDR